MGAFTVVKVGMVALPYDHLRTDGNNYVAKVDIAV
jgi:hypothetical protein